MHSFWKLRKRTTANRSANIDLVTVEKVYYRAGFFQQALADHNGDSSLSDGPLFQFPKVNVPILPVTNRTVESCHGMHQPLPYNTHGALEN